MPLRLMMWLDWHYCGKDFQDKIKRLYCDDCIVKHKKEPLPKSSTRMRMIRNKEFVKNYKKDKKCRGCGYNKHPSILDFHHLNRNEKVDTINSLMKGLHPIYLIKKEIGKCILICPNCHREMHLLEDNNEFRTHDN